VSLKRFLSKVVGDPNERELKQVQPLADAINALESAYEALSDAQLRAKTAEFLRRLDGGETLDDILIEAFAAVREASKRTIGLRHYDVQLIGGVALHRGYAMEMKTGEGKTLVATLPLYLNALSRQGVHLVTVNDYLARRDVQWMGPIYHMLGVSVGLLQQGDQQPSFVYDPAYSRGGDDYDRLRPVRRREAYRAHITYGTNSEFGFDYLRDNSAYLVESRVQRGFYYAIVDEVDNILIDEARTPLIISGPANEPTNEYYLLADVARQLTPDDYVIDERSRGISLTDAGYDHVERLLGMPLFDPYTPEEVSPRQAKLHHHLEQALKAEYIFRKDRDYIIQGGRKSGRVIIVDEFTGRTMPGRRWSDGLHQAVEAKEDVPIRQENITYATITLQNYFRMYDKLAGMTGTAATEAEEFEKIYDLAVLVLPTHRPVIRQDHSDVILRTQEAKFRAIIQEIVSMHCLGRPMLVGTTSVETSEYLNNRLESSMLRRLANVALLRDRLNAGQVNGGVYRESMQVLNQPLESISSSTLRKLGDQLGVSVHPTGQENATRLAELFQVDDPSRLLEVLNRGVPHNVLNARRHTEEALIVARAGEVGAVTIATNMAGRGVDIKLGGELDDQALAEVNRVLYQNDIAPYDLSFAEMAEALQRLDPGDYYLYQEAVNKFIQHVADEERVKSLGGLHVLGTERHEARRIDNQLRGRSGRQGDPGSSRFYLSLEDDLMRRFGGKKVSDLVARLGAEDDVPLALGIVSRAIANAQMQVEGYNFDVRKHLLEYDDVLNTQREVIYEQRKRVSSKPDLRGDVWAMVEAEVRQRVDTVFAQVDGDHMADMFRLVYYLEHIQPTTTVAEGALFPSFTLKYVLSTLPVEGSPQEVRDALAETVQHALDSQRRHIYAIAEQSMERALEVGQDGVERLLDAASMAYEGVEMEFAEAGREPDPQILAGAVSQNTGLELDAYVLRDLQGRKLEQTLMDQVRVQAQLQVRTRMLGQVAQRAGIGRIVVDESLLTEADDRVLLTSVLKSIDRVLTKHVERQIAEIQKDTASRIRGPSDCTFSGLLRFLQDVQFGTRTGFDKGHRKVSTQVERFQFTAWVAERIAGWDRERLEKEILSHLNDAVAAWAAAWGRLEFQRIGANLLSDLDEETRTGLMRVFGPERLEKLAGVCVSDLPSEDAVAVRAYLGERVLFNVQRQLMLDITSRFWVEHLTSMEVLRQGIGLQSYAQKDPLAEYKVRAYDMFQDMLQSIQTQIVTAMFTYRPRDLAQVRVGVDRRKRGTGSTSEQPAHRSEKRSRKRRRRRK
jgi:preprotein translocase subunit SecA